MDLENLFPEVQLITEMAGMYKLPKDDLFTCGINLQRERINPSPSALCALKESQIKKKKWIFFFNNFTADFISKS